VRSDGKIVNISKTYQGKIHDFRIHKESDKIPINTRVYANSGYQGLNKRIKNAKILIKAQKCPQNILKVSS
jgi:phage gp46-like protein